MYVVMQGAVRLAGAVAARVVTRTMEVVRLDASRALQSPGLMAHARDGACAAAVVASPHWQASAAVAHPAALSGSRPTVRWLAKNAGAPPVKVTFKNSAGDVVSVCACTECVHVCVCACVRVCVCACVRACECLGVCGCV
jgi:hypothetical protein